MPIASDIVTLPIKKLGSLKAEIIKILCDRYNIPSNAIEIVSSCVRIECFFFTDRRIKLSKTVLIAKKPSSSVQSGVKATRKVVSEVL